MNSNKAIKVIIAAIVVVALVVTGEGARPPRIVTRNQIEATR